MAICDQCSLATQILACSGENRRNRIGATLPRWQSSKDIQCWICYKFVGWLESERFGVLETWSKQRLEVEYHAYGRYEMDLPESDLSLPPLCIEISPFGDTEPGCEIELNFVTAEEFAKHEALTPKAQVKDTLNIELIQSWFDGCINNHETCKAVNKQWFPTRLLDLGSQNSEAKLIISADTPPQGHYMTLSHRWGSQKYKKLESSTIRQLQNAIELETLPQAFQDAVQVARILKIRYIWIDSLCIRQDEKDLSDWEIESLTMDKVYSHAILNVSATLSQDGSEPLFQQQQFQTYLLPSKIEIEIEHKHKLQTFYVFDGEIWKDEIDDSPLNRRGWVFQERYLAPRVLHFGRHQVGWECCELEALEMFPSGFLGVNVMSKQTKIRKESEARRAAESTGHPKTTFTEYWQDLITAYSRSNLTFPKDKLVAFAGIAKSILESRTDRYCAGMWEKSLCFCLPWRRDVSDRRAFPIWKTSGRAPTWSWASVDGEITFPLLLGGIKAILAENSVFVDDSASGNFLNAPRAIQLRCLCFPVSVELTDDEGMILSFDVEGFQFKVDDVLSESQMDVEIPHHKLLLLLERQKLFLTPLFASAYSFNAILLEPTNGGGSYFRVGSVEIRLKSGTKSELAPKAASDIPFAPVVAHAEANSTEVRTKATEWNMNAFQFLHHCFEQSASARMISIL